MSVYFATSGRYTKIGYSHDPLGRISTITRNGTRPADVEFLADAELVGWISGGTVRERELHAVFADAWVAGEWFVIDQSVIRDLIWADPTGVDIHRMSALAVFAMNRDPSLTRDELADAGQPVEGVPLVDALANLNGFLSTALRKAAS